MRWSYIGLPMVALFTLRLQRRVMRTGKGQATSRKQASKIGVGAICGPVCSSVGDS